MRQLSKAAVPAPSREGRVRRSTVQNEDTAFLAPVWQYLPEHRNWTVLDLGRGAPGASSALRAQGHTVVEVGDPVTLKAARLTERRFDLIYCYRCFERFPEPRRVLQDLLKLARVGAPLLIQASIPMQETGRLRVVPQATSARACLGHRAFARAVVHTPHRIAWADRDRVVIRAWMGDPWLTQFLSDG